MSGKRLDVHGRLDNILSCIAMETREIQELEQQLTDGQILANELLQKDLEGILGAFQEYLRRLRLKVSELQAENESLRRHLKDAQRLCGRLEDSAHTCAQKITAQQEALAALKMEAKVQKRQKAELKVELRDLKEELGQETRFRTSLDQTQNQDQMASLQDQLHHNHIVWVEEKSLKDLNRTPQLGDHVTKYQNLIDQLQDQSATDRKCIAELEDCVTRYKKHVAQLEDRVTQYQSRVVHLESQAKGSAMRGRPSARPPLGVYVDSLLHNNKKPHQDNKPQHTNRCVSQLCEEVQCVEQTLHRRRAELREADRRLMDAHTRFHNDKVASQNSAADVKQITLRLRKLRDEEVELMRRRRTEHRRLNALKAELRDREAESQELCNTVHMATQKLAELLSDCRAARASLDWTLAQVCRLLRAPKHAHPRPSYSACVLHPGGTSEGRTYLTCHNAMKECMSICHHHL
ncbi:uncharacterized protein LOC144073965 isoform X2 [Stigmatopora argus]